jgi:hypothetical protein
MAMARQKRRVAARKKVSKRSKSKARAKPVAKKTAKRATAKKAKKRVAKSGRAVKAKKRAARPGRAVKAKKVARKAGKRKTPQTRQAAPQMETVIIDVIEEPVPGVTMVTEYEAVQMRRPASRIEEPEEPREGPGPGPVSEE